MHFTFPAIPGVGFVQHFLKHEQTDLRETKEISEWWKIKIRVRINKRQDRRKEGEKGRKSRQEVNEGRNEVWVERK